MKLSNRNTRRYRMYIGKSNWINLSEKATEDLLRIYEEGKATRYELAPGLALDIMPDDVDCNTKNTGLPRLMRADLRYEDGDEGQTQQTLSSYVKSLLEEQGILDAFAPVKYQGDPSLPRVTEISTHRHLSMVPAPVAMTRRASRSSSSSSQTTPLASEQTSPTMRKRRSTLIRRAKAAPTRKSNQRPWPATSSSGPPLDIAGSSRSTALVDTISAAVDAAAAAAAAAAVDIDAATSGVTETTGELATVNEAQQHNQHHHHPHTQDTHSYFSSAASSLYTSPHLLGPTVDHSAGSNDNSTVNSWSDRHAHSRGLFRRTTDTSSAAAIGLHFEQEAILNAEEEQQNSLLMHHQSAAAAAAAAAAESEPTTPWLWHDPAQHHHHHHHNAAHSSSAQHSLTGHYFPNQPVYLHHIPYSLENFSQQGSMHLIQHQPSYQTTPDEDRSTGSSLAEGKPEDNQDRPDDSPNNSTH